MAKSSKTSLRRSAQTGTFEIIQRAEQSLPVRLLAGMVRLRVELTLLTVLIALWWAIDRYLAAGLGAWLILAALTVTVLVIPRSRTYIWTRVWCVFDRHQLRKTLVSARVMTHDGRLPRLLWARPIPVGERVWLLLRPGLSGHHLEKVTDEIASACVAREARVHIHQKWTVFCHVDIVRRDPLSAAEDIDSDLLAGRPITETGGQLIPLPDRSTVTAAAPSEQTGTTTSATTSATTTPITRAPTHRGKTRTTPAAQPAEPVATGRSGEDVSDYV